MASTLVEITYNYAGAVGFEYRGQDHKRDYATDLILYVNPICSRKDSLFFIATLDDGKRMIRYGTPLYEGETRTGRLGWCIEETDTYTIYGATANSKVRGWDTEEQLIKHLIKRVE